jgi:zinc transporter ZupT
VNSPQGIAILLGVAASAATLAGGAIALRTHRRLGTILGLAAGMVIGVALFDLLPEALRLASPRFGVGSVLATTGLALLGYMFIDRLTDGSSNTPSRVRAYFAPSSLILHSFLDGTGIGVAFQLSAATGWLVALAVIAHDVADGVNMVSLSLATSGRRNDRRSARRWLVLNAMAPIAGVLAGSAVSISAPVMGALLALFAGIFLYLGACHLLPRSHALRPSPLTGAASLAGALLMLAVVNLAR